MLKDWKTSVMVPMYKGKRDVMNCRAYRVVMLLEHEIKIVEKILKKRIGALVVLDDMQFGFLPGRETTDAFFILRRMQEEYRKNDKKLYMCFVDLEKAFDRVSRRVMQWALRKGGLPDIFVKAVMSLYESSKIKFKVGFAFSEECKIVVGVHQGSVLSPLLFVIVIDVVTENAREGLMKVVLYTDE